MKEITKSVSKRISTMALFTAKIAAGAASIWGFYQPKEPVELKSQMKKERHL
jgi:cyclic lactone autoinducer peptide